jgi:hypothetical protein
MTDPKRWEKMMPREMGLYLSLSSLQRVASGQAGSASASTVVPTSGAPNNVEVIAKGLGYNTFREATKWDYVIAKKEAEAHVTLERNGLVEQFFEAWSGKDQKEIGAVRDSIMKFNKELSGTEFRGYAIEAKSLLESIEQRQKQKIGMERSLPLQKRQAPVFEQFKYLFPEAQGVIDVRKAP